MTPCSIDPAHGDGSHGTVVGPVCSECWRVRLSRGLEGDIADGVKAGVRGLGAFQGRTPDGKVPLGAHDGWHDAPVAEPDDHHTFPIVLSGVVMWQQGQPVRVPGAVFAGSPDAKAMEYRRAQSAEHRTQLAEALTMIADGVAGSKEDLSALLGINPAKLQRMKPRGR